MGAHTIRNITKVWRSTTARLFGRLSPGDGRGEELTAEQVRTFLGVTTNTGGDLALNHVVLGAGGSDTKTVPGFNVLVSPGITTVVTIGEAAANVGGLQLWNDNGDSSFLFAFDGPTTSNVFLPPAGQIATTDQPETFTNKTLTDPIINVAGTDAPGDVYYRDALGVFTRLGIGTAGQVLQVNAGLPAWGPGGGGGGGFSFSTISVAGQSDVVAELTTDTLTLVAGSNVTITTDPVTDSITISATGGGAASYTMATLDAAVTDGDVMFQGRNETVTGIKTLTGPRLATNITQTTEPTSTPAGTTQTIDLANGNHQTLALTSATGTVTATITPPQGPSAGTIIIKQHATVTKGLVWAVSSGSLNWIGTEPTWASDLPDTTRVISWRYDGAVTHLAAGGGSGSGSAQNVFSAIAVSGQSNVSPDTTTDTLTLVAGSGMTITTDAATDTITFVSSGGAASNSFATIAVSGQSSVVADAATDTLTLVAGTNITITTNAATDTITISATGGGGSGTVTNTGGALTVNGIMMGAGGVDSKVHAGLSASPGPTTALNIGNNAGIDGHLLLWNATSFSHTISNNPASVANVTVTMPPLSGIMATINAVETFTNKTIVLNTTIRMASEVTGTPVGTTQTIDLTLGNHQTLSLVSATGTVTATITVPATSSAGTIIVKQHASAVKDLTWVVSAGTIKWMGTEPDWALDAIGSVRIVSWRYDGSVMYLAATSVGV